MGLAVNYFSKDAVTLVLWEDALVNVQLLSGYALDLAFFIFEGDHVWLCVKRVLKHRMKGVQLDVLLLVDVILVICVAEMTITEAAQKSALVADFEDLLDFVEVEGALSNIIVRVERIINARHLSSIQIWYPIVKVLWFHHISRRPAHYAIFHEL